MFWKAICDNLGTIIGVIGSIFGVVLGWWLNNITKKGKLIINVKNGLNGEFLTKDGFPATSIDNSQKFAYKVNLEIYNSSEDIKVMKDIKITFHRKGFNMFSVAPYDESLKHRINNSIPIHKNVGIINCPAKMATMLILYGWIKNDDIQKVYESGSVFLSYKDEFGKETIKLIGAIDYKTYEFYKGEQ